MTEFSNDWDDLMDKVTAEAESAGLIKKGDTVVFSAGMPLQVSGTTNLIVVKVVQ